MCYRNLAILLEHPFNLRLRVASNGDAFQEDFFIWMHSIFASYFEGSWRICNNPNNCWSSFYSLTLSVPAFLYNFEDQVGVESSTTCSRYFSGHIRDRQLWIGNPKNWEQSIAYREKKFWKSPTQCWEIWVQKTLFFARFFKNVEYRTNSLIEVPRLPTENCS